MFLISPVHVFHEQWLQGSIRGTSFTGTYWQLAKINRDENMIGNINAADRQTKTAIEINSAELSVHPSMENTYLKLHRNWQNCTIPHEIWFTFLLADLFIHHIFYIFWSVCHGTISVKPFTDVSTRGHYISVFNQLLIIKVSRGPQICLPEQLEWLLRSQRCTWLMPPALFILQRLSKGNKQTMTLSKTFPFVLITS